jgi:hypothetical protein
MKILVVAATAMDADHLRRQAPNKKVVVVAPGQCFAQRFDVIFVTDQYRRERGYASEERRAAMDDWFKTFVMTRLDPDGRIMHL